MSVYTYLYYYIIMDSYFGIYSVAMYNTSSYNNVGQFGYVSVFESRIK